MPRLEKTWTRLRAKEPRSGEIHRLYATIYGRQGDEPRARYHLTEQAALRGDTEEAQSLLAGAMTGLKPGSKTFRQVSTDLKVYPDAQPKKDDKKRR